MNKRFEYHVIMLIILGFLNQRNIKDLNGLIIAFSFGLFSMNKNVNCEKSDRKSNTGNVGPLLEIIAAQEPEVHNVSK